MTTAKELRISMRTAHHAGACLWVTLLVGSASIARAADKPQFGGNWTFVQDQSDDANKKIHEAQQASATTQGRVGGGSPDEGYPSGGYPGGGYPGGRPPGGGGIGPSTGRGGIWPGRTGDGPSGPGPRAGAPQGGGIVAVDWEELAADVKVLRIQQNEQQISITDDAGHTKTLYPDGKKHKEQGSGEKTIAIKTRWDGDRLVAESKMGHSGKLAETYELSPDGKQLYVTSRLDSSQLAAPLTIRRVYDRGTANPQ